MTYWPASTVAHFAREAGFRDDELVEAIAVALASSGAQDAYVQDSFMPGVSRMVGLFGIDVVLFTDYTEQELFDPRESSRAAYELTLLQPRGFAWSAVYRAGAHREFMEQSRAAARNIDAAPRLSSTGGDTVGRSDLDGLVSGLRGQAVMMAKAARAVADLGR